MNTIRFEHLWPTYVFIDIDEEFNNGVARDGTETEPVAGAQPSAALNQLTVDPSGEAFLADHRPHDQEAAFVALEPTVAAAEAASISHRQDELIFAFRSISVGVVPA